MIIKVWSYKLLLHEVAAISLCQLDIIFNFNGAIFQDAHRIGIGVVIWDSHGFVIASMSQKIPQLLTIVEAKAAIAAWALEFALEVKLTKLF